MKKIFAIILFVFLAATMNAQTGTWSGKLDVQGTKLPLVFHLDGDNPSMDSPDQGARGIPIQIVRDGTGKVTINIPSIFAKFEGNMSDASIVGAFTQRGISFPMTLTKGDHVKANRPQTPQGPFPYATENVTFTNGDAVLKGTLTLPEGYSRKTPVLVMVTGSGVQNRDEEIFEHKPFAVIADYFARHGIATLRYDDRGFGESTGDLVNVTTDDLMKDALAGVQLLRGRFDKVGVIGHSEGGTISMMLAANGQVDFIISLAGNVISGAETLLWQNRVLLSSVGVEESVVDSYTKALKDQYDAIANNLSLPQTDSLALPDQLKRNLKAVVAQLKTPYMKRFLQLDMRQQLARIKCPVLALNGTLDTQVNYASNLEALRNGLPKNKKNLIVQEDGLNHMFQHCKTGAITEYKEIEETFAPEILTLMVKWMTDTNLSK